MEGFEGKKEKVLKMSQAEGFRKGAYAGIFSTIGVMAANHYSTFFKTKLSVSAKTAIALSPALGVYSFTAEMLMYNAGKDPFSYGIYPDGHEKDQPVVQKVDRLKWYHSAANFAYNKPLILIGSIGIPTISAVYWNQNRAGHEHLNLSHRILNTRVLGQFSFLAIILSVMFFRDYMDHKGGLFVENEEGAIVREHEPFE
eukprot:CAMPEP_0171477730 /NCGR_PEP_ID=MMETSP0946-20130122/4362_1 /TAXON_ID=109269 /ORGANISM="Vaucheria litorea, Strain CCMP2940" /LENGTH=198 /DNA_ID=CAMNT_0012008243 /DNA_START=63 /DNA_END=659 /DNA_ORIENTATION=-